MKHLILLLLILIGTQTLLAQDQINIDLGDLRSKKENVSFTISQVQDSRSLPNNIGEIKKNKNKKIEIKFASNSPLMIQEFINNQFDQESEMHVLMQIESLDIETVKIKDKEVRTFIFACKFYKQGDNNNEPLYTFNARNSIARKKGLQLALTNYIGRAITSAVLNFNKSYKKHPDWRIENTSIPKVVLKKKILYNEMESGDTIALNGKYKLLPTDFWDSGTEEEEDEAFSTLIITYTLDAAESDNKISITINPKAFFLRSRSWSKQSDSTNWLAHQQLLFDLASYHGYLFKTALEKFNFTPGFYKTEANKIYNEISAAYFDEMDLLQAETQYGTLVEKERDWRNKVNKYLMKF